MADEVKGVAVLDDRGPECLMICCACDPPRAGDDPVHFARLPLRGRGAPGDGWEYDEQGDMIHVTPSVMLSTRIPIAGREAEFPEVGEKKELFHNSGDWTVRFVRWSKLSQEERGPPDDGCYSIWRRLNASLLGE